MFIIECVENNIYEDFLRSSYQFCFSYWSSFPPYSFYIVETIYTILFPVFLHLTNEQYELFPHVIYNSV